MFRACNALFGFVSVIYRAVFSNILPYVVTIRLERRFAVIYREFFANPLPFRWERVEGAEGTGGAKAKGRGTARAEKTCALRAPDVPQGALRAHLLFGRPLPRPV